MPDLSFAIQEIEPVLRLPNPHFRARIRITNRSRQEKIHSIALRCQAQLDPVRRRYTPEQRAALKDLFGSPEQWAAGSLRSLLLASAKAAIPSFADAIITEFSFPCSFDVNLAAANYLTAISEGEIPIVVLFNGTVFFEPDGRGLQVAQIPWDAEASYRLPAQVWSEAVVKGGEQFPAAAFSNATVQHYLDRWRAEHECKE